ncbi:MAG: hypothetical protein NTX56_01315 [Proteobacteria bacterium]|nr:hypothetical protein [Pseudomonadota bacterium]
MNKLLKEAWSFFCFTLVLIGIIGLSWSAFGDQGWIERLWGVAWSAELRHPILAVPVIGGTLLLVWLFIRGGLEPGKTSRLADLLVYVTMLSGAYFLWQYWRSGTFPF